MSHDIRTCNMFKHLTRKPSDDYLFLEEGGGYICKVPFCSVGISPVSIDSWIKLVANSTANYQERCTFGYLPKLSPIRFHSIYNSLLSEERERSDPLHSFSTLSTAEQMSFMGVGGVVLKAISKSNECMATSPSLSIFSPINDHLFFNKLE